MNTKLKKNGSLVRERIINLNDSGGQTQQHRIKGNSSTKRRKLDNQNDKPDMEELLHIGTELGYDGSEMILAAREKQVSCAGNNRPISHAGSISHSSVCLLIGLKSSQATRKHSCSTNTLDPFSYANAIPTWLYSNAKHAYPQVFTVLIVLPDSTRILLSIASLNGVAHISRMFMHQKLDSVSKCRYVILMALFVIHATRFKNSLSLMLTVSTNSQLSSVHVPVVIPLRWIFSYLHSSSSQQV
jgi:hypothetical protein